ncbi:MAG: DUF4118 domain-containing protein [Novosphingobium sp.]
MEKVSSFKRLMAERSASAKVAGIAGALVVATGARWFLDQGRSGAPFAFYFPVILLSAVAFGWRWTMVAIATSTVAASLFFIQPFMKFQVSDLAVALPFLISCSIIAFFGEMFRRAIVEGDRRAEDLHRFNRELHHRAGNLAAVLRMLVSKARTADDPVQALALLEGRINALFSSSQLLGYGIRPACVLNELVRLALAPFDDSKIQIEGPTCSVAESAAVPLAMALHELGTNAAKYGALSNPFGMIRLCWQVKNDGSVGLTWTETGGPAVEVPSRTGMGSRLLRPYRGLRAVKIVYDPRGVICHLHVDGAASMQEGAISSSMKSSV